MREPFPCYSVESVIDWEPTFGRTYALKSFPDETYFKGFRSREDSIKHEDHRSDTLNLNYGSREVSVRFGILAFATPNKHQRKLDSELFSEFPHSMDLFSFFRSSTGT